MPCGSISASTICNIIQYSIFYFRAFCFLNAYYFFVVKFKVSLDRGREGIENQERDVLKRVYELRKNLAIENRKKQGMDSILSR